MADATNASPPERPAEQLPITIFDGVVLAARAHNGMIYLGLRDLCETLSLSLSSQRRRILANESLHLVQFRVVLGNQLRTLDFLLLDDLALWLMTIQERRAAPEVRERLGYVKRYLESAVRTAFAQLVGLPEAPTSQVEDLEELDQMDQALRQLEQLAQRQNILETSQDRARIAYRELHMLVDELRERVRVLEQQSKYRINPTQRNTLYRLVQAWGAARAEQDPRLSSGVAIRKAWVEFNARFNISTYTDLPAARYDEAILFVKQSYLALTGKEIEAVQQAQLAYEDE